jgi:hypothetical protein
MLVRMTFPFWKKARRCHGPLVVLGREVDPSSGLWQPQLHPAVLEQRGHERILGAVERPLILWTTIASASARVGQLSNHGHSLPHVTLSPTSKNSVTMNP